MNTQLKLLLEEMIKNKVPVRGYARSRIRLRLSFYSRVLQTS